MSEERKSFALLIDSDNVSARYIQAIMNELTSRHGQVTYRRIYGDWTSSQMGRWKDVLAEHSLTPMQQFPNTKGKNATDSFLIIDAMDILYEGKVQGFCIVSSDGDFTRLASRLRDAGMTVIGMGEQKTPRSFRNACSVFTALELIADGEDQGRGQRGQVDVSAPTKHEISSAIVGIVNESSGETVPLSDIGSRLVSIYPDFDVRSFGYSQLSKFIESFDNLKLERRDNLVLVSLLESRESMEEVEAFIREEVSKRGDAGLALSILGDFIHDRFPNFNVKDYGYSKLSKFMRHMRSIEVADEENGTFVYPGGE